MLLVWKKALDRKEPYVPSLDSLTVSLWVRRLALWGVRMTHHLHSRSSRKLAKLAAVAALGLALAATGIALLAVTRVPPQAGMG